MPNPNKPNNNINSHGRPRINLDERIAKKQATPAFTLFDLLTKSNPEYT